MRSRILSIDTTSEFGSLALVRDGELVEEAELHSTEGFGHILYTGIERLLDKHGWKVSDIDCFASTAGPGSFTGIRVGLAAVKGLGEALGRPVAAVSNLQAIAWHGSGPFRAALLDARRGETYGAVYSADLALVSPEVVGGLAEWLETLQYENLELLSTSCGPLRDDAGRDTLRGSAHDRSPAGLGGRGGSHRRWAPRGWAGHGTRRR